MIGDRIKIAKRISKKRFQKWYPDYDPRKPMWKNFDKDAELGILRKTNVRCSKDCCCNPRHSKFYNEVEKLTIQERKAPTIDEEWY